MEQFLSAKFLSGRNANQKIGILDSTENVKVLEVVGRAGIGTTIFDADYQLDVRGDAFIRDTLTVDKLTVTGAGSSFADLNVTGVSTFGGDIDANAGLDVDGLTDLDELNVSGLSTFASDLDVNASVDISTDLTVDGLSDLDELNVAGIATFASDLDVNASVDISTNLTVDGLSDLDELNVAGIATFASNIDVDGLTDLDELNVAGIATFASNIDVDGLTDLDELNVAGIATFASNIDANAGLDVSGIATFASDLDVNASVDISTDLTVDGLSDLDELNVAGIATFASNIDANGGLDVDGRTDLEQLNVVGLSTFTSNVDINASVDISGHTELDTLNVSVATTSASLTLANAGVAVTAILDEDDLISNRDDALATQQSIKAYVDSQITSQDLDFAGDTGTGAVDLDSETFTVAGTTNEIETVGSGTTLTIGLPNTVAITTSLTVGSATTITGAGIVAGIVTGTLDNDLTLATSGTGLSGSATYNNSGAATFTVASNATDANTGGTIVARDGSGNFSAGTITADLVGDVTGDLTGVASTATKLQNARDFSITGSFVTAPAISFDGTGNVALAATITPDSIGLGTYTSGDYVQSITGTSNEIEVTGGTGEGSTPQIGLPNDVTISQDLTVNRDVQIVRNLNVDGNITVGGTTATIFAETLKISDPDLILGIRTDAFGNDISTDNTANHGGIAIASTEGTPLIVLTNPGAGETLPPTYKKIMWFKSGSFSGLGTDAWLLNYAVGIGSTQFPTGTRFAAGNVQVTENDISVVRDINASGIITASRFTSTVSTGTAPLTVSSTTLVSNLNADLLDGQEGSYYTDASNINAGTIDDAYLPDIITSNINVTTGISTISEVIVGSAVTINSSGINAASGIVTALQFIGTASTASFATTAYTLDGKSEGELSVGTAVTATNLAGGDAGDIPYQSAEGTTTFVDATGAGTGQVLLWNGSAPVWDSITAAAGNFGGMTVQDEGVTVGTASSVGTINFVGGNIQATATTGANGISTVTLSDTPTFDSLTLESTDAGSAAAPELTLYRNSASPAPGDYLGQIMFKGRNDNNADENYAKITGKITDETLGTEDGLIETAIKGNGVFTIVSRQTPTQLQLLNGTGLDVTGTAAINGDVDLGGSSASTITANGYFDSGLNPSASSTYDLGAANSWRNLNISGIATLGTVEISSGIVTAVSGVVTYYGDGQYLDGINTDLLSDTTPQLGGNLDLNGFSIDGIGNINITGIITTSGDINVGSGITLYASTGIISATSYYGSGGNLEDIIGGKIGGLQVQEEGSNVGTGFTFSILNFVGPGVTATAGIGSTATITIPGDISVDTTPQLGGDLDLNSNDITGTGNVNITGIITATSFVGDGSGITGVAGTGGLFNLIEDTTPQLGGNLDLNSNDITGTGNVNITGIITATSFSGDGSGITGVAGTGGLFNLVEDTTPQLGGDLDLNSNDITGTGNVNITGIITATSFSGDGSALTGITSITNGSSYVNVSASGGDIVLQRGTSTTVTVDNTGVVIEDASPYLTIKDSDTSDTTLTGIILWKSSTDIERGELGFTAGDSNFYITNKNNASIIFKTDNNPRLVINNNGDSVYPYVNNDTDLGTTSNKFRNAYFSASVNVGGNLNVSGLTTSQNLNVSGVVTATSFVGDGSALTGVSAGTTPTENTTNQSQYIPFYVGTSSTDVAGISTQSFVFNPSTKRMGIGTDAPAYNLHVVGDFAATSKSFVIDHPTKSGKKLRYASLEGPEQGVYVRGRSQEAVIDLPDYWTGLVDEETITVNLTPIGHSAAPRVERIVNNTVNVFSKEEGELDYYYTVYAERKDIEKLVVEY